MLAQDCRLVVVEMPPPDAVAGRDGLARVLGKVVDLAPGRTATALRIALGDDEALVG